MEWLWEKYLEVKKDKDNLWDEEFIIYSNLKLEKIHKKNKQRIVRRYRIMYQKVKEAFPERLI